MKIFTLFKKVMPGILFGISLTLLVFQSNLSMAQVNQEDDPNLDQVPKYLRANPPKSTSLPLSTVITVGNWDNFNLGTDFAESNMTAHMQDPSKYFTAYNINVGHHTENGVDWANTVPNFGASMQGDPVVAYDSLGNLFYENMYGSSILGCKVVKSTDNGATWGAGVTAISGNDKNWLACDQTSGPYANYVYTTMTNNGVGNFARSTDHGATFTSTFAPTTQSLPGMMVCVGPYNNIQGGSVYVVTNSGSSFASTYTFYRSLDGGATFTKSSNQSFSGYVGSVLDNRNSVETMRTRPYPMIAADNSYGSHRGTLYVVYASNDPPGNGNKPDIWCRASADGGVTWTDKVRVNDDPNTTLNHQWHPAIWCDKETGKLYAMWMDSRDTPTHDSAYIYASYSIDGGQTWAANQRISNKKMKIACTTCGGGGVARYQGDYNGIISNKKVAQAGWTDFRQGTFMSATAYFPDFAMAIDHASDTLYTSADSATFMVSVPEVKLYTDTVLLSGVLTPTPASGSVVFHFPNGNVITSYPDSKPVNVVLYGNVPTGNYTANFYAKGPNGTPVHKRTATIKVLPGSGFLVSASATPPNICEGQTSQLNVSVIGGTAPFTYSWTPPTGLSDPTIANPVASPLVTTNYHVLVSDAATHTTSDSVLVTVSTGPSAPGPIAGIDTVCVGATSNYSIVDVVGATSYSWTVPADAQITSGQNTTAISVLWGSTSGNISVIAGNNCGNSTPSVKGIILIQPPAPLGVISGPLKNCKATTATYMVSQGNSSDMFTWTVPADVTIQGGQNTNTIQVLWGSSAGDVSVYAENLCGVTAAVSLTIGVDSLPSAAGTITGKDTVCMGQNGYVYSIDDVPGALTYDWSVPAGVNINGSESGKQITLDISATAVSGEITVKGRNDCGTGTENTKSVFVSTCAGLPENIMNGNISVYPNPTDRLLNVAFRSPVKKVSLVITDVNGKEVFKQSLENIQVGYIRQINVAEYSKGIYFIKVLNNEQVYTEKFVVY